MLLSTRTVNRILWTLVVVGTALAALGALSFSKLQGKIDELRLEGARLQSSKAVIQMAIFDVSDLSKMSDADMDQACKFSANLQKPQFFSKLSDNDKTAYLNSVWNICANTPGSHLNEQRAFLKFYWMAVNKRVQEDFPAAANLYAKASATPGIEYVVSAWRVRALEGQGYALMRMNQLQEAQAELDRAKVLAKTVQGGFVFAELSSIKLECRNKADAGVVRADLAAVRARLDALKNDPKGSADQKRYAGLDRKSVEDDAELFYLCRYAEVKPQAL